MWARCALNGALATLSLATLSLATLSLATLSLAIGLAGCGPLSLDLGRASPSTTDAGAAVAVPDSCPLDAPNAGSCATYATDAVCKLGLDWYRCDGKDWHLAGSVQAGEDFPLPPEELTCPKVIAEAASCVAYASRFMCCVTTDEWYECEEGVWVEADY